MFEVNIVIRIQLMYLFKIKLQYLKLKFNNNYTKIYLRYKKKQYLSKLNNNIIAKLD